MQKRKENDGVTQWACPRSGVRKSVTAIVSLLTSQGSNESGKQYIACMNREKQQYIACVKRERGNNISRV